jgi:hypothetical protein
MSYDFQAPGFYEKSDFRRVAELTDWPPGHTHVVVMPQAPGKRDAANQTIDAGMVIEKVRDAVVSTPEDVLKSVQTDRQQRRTFVPMLISTADGPLRGVLARVTTEARGIITFRIASYSGCAGNSRLNVQPQCKSTLRITRIWRGLLHLSVGFREPRACVTLFSGAREAIGFAIADGYSFRASCVGAETWACPDQRAGVTSRLWACAQAWWQDHRKPTVAVG